MGLFKSKFITTVKQAEEYGRNCVNELYDNAIRLEPKKIYPDNFITNFEKLLLLDRKDWQLDHRNHFIYKGIGKLMPIDCTDLEDFISKIVAMELRLKIKDSKIATAALLSGVVEARKISRERMESLPFEVEGLFISSIQRKPLLSLTFVSDVMMENFKFDSAVKGKVYLSNIFISEELLIDLMDIRENDEKIDELKNFLESQKRLISSGIVGDKNKIINDL